MVESTQKEETPEEFAIRVEKLLEEAKVLQIVKSANILIDLFGFEKAFKRR